MVDIHNYQRKIEYYIEALNSIRPQDKGDILAFKKQLEIEEISLGRIAKYLWTLRSISKMLSKPLQDCTKEDIIELVAKINKSNYSEWSKHDFKALLKRFYKWLNGGEDYPDSIRWLKVKGSSDRMTSDEILTPEEVKMIASNMPNQIFKAFVLTLFASGTRIGELLPLKIKNVTFDDKGVILNVDGKTGKRRVRIDAPFYNYYINELASWLSSHPDKTNSEAFLWAERKGNSFILYKNIRKYLIESAEKSGINKPINPHAFRHASATFDSSLPVELKKAKYGWKSTRIIDVYTSLSGTNVDNEILRYRGVDIKDNGQMNKLMAKICIKCNHENKITDHLCSECGFPVDYEGYVKIDNENMLKREASYRFIVKLAEKDPENEKVWLDILDDLGIRHLWDTKDENNGKSR